MSLKTAGLLALATVLAVLSGGVARADGAADSKRLSTAAASDFKAGNLTSAEEKWEAAYKAFPDPNILYALGRCYAADGKPDKSAAALREFLDKSPRYAKRAEVQKLIKEQEAKAGVAAPVAKPEPAAPPPPPVVPATPPPAPPEPQAAPVAPVASAPSEGGTFWNRDLLKKWWVWAAVGGVVVVGAAVGVGVGLGTRGNPQFPDVGPGISSAVTF